LKARICLTFHSSIPEESLKLKKIGGIHFSKLKSLENLTLYSALRKGALKDEISQQGKLKPLRPSKIKTISVCSSTTGEWFIIKKNAVNFKQEFLGRIWAWRKIRTSKE